MVADALFRRMLAAAYDLHRHHEPHRLESRLTELLGQALESDSAALVTVEAGSGEFRLAAWPPDRFGHLDRDEAMRLHAADHPFVARCRQTRSASAFRLSDLAARAAFEQTGLYRHLYRFLGIEFQLLMLVASPDARWRALALNRRSHDFSDEERLALEAFWPHIMLAQRDARRRLRPIAPGTVGAPPASGSGVMVVSSLGAVTMCSEQARTWLADYFGARYLMRGVTLPERLLAWVLERVERESRGKGLRVERRDPLVVARGDACLMLDLRVDRGKHMHLLTLEEVVLNAPAPALRELGLTPREAEVLSWIAQGKTNREVGMILGSSTRTVQKQLEHIFEKLGVENRTAAILRAWQAARFGAIAAAGVTRPSSPR